MNTAADTTPDTVRLKQWKEESLRLKAAVKTAEAELARLNRELDAAQSYVRDYGALVKKP